MAPPQFFIIVVQLKRVDEFRVSGTVSEKGFDFFFFFFVIRVCKLLYDTRNSTRRD